MTAERNKFQFAAVRTAIHGTTVRRVTTVNHLLYVFHNNGTWMESIFNFFVVFFKNLLQDIHKSIMKESETENNPKSRLCKFTFGFNRMEFTHDTLIKYQVMTCGFTLLPIFNFCKFFLRRSVYGLVLSKTVRLCSAICQGQRH